MSDLISRSVLIKVLKDRATNEAIMGYMTAYDVTNSIIDEVEEQPTAYDIDKVVEELEERKALHERLVEYENKNGTVTEKYQHIKAIDVLNDAIEIVKQETEKYNNGWIPCSEKLPDVRQDVLVTVKYTGFMGMHGYWIKTGHMEAENDWWGDCAGGEVIAWQPLPKPFKERD